MELQSQQQPSFNLKACWDNIRVEYSCLDEVGSLFALTLQLQITGE